MRCVIWKILYFWKFDNVKWTIVGMFVMKWLHTAVWGGHNYAFVADVIVRKMVIIIIIIIIISSTTLIGKLPVLACIICKFAIYKL